MVVSIKLKETELNIFITIITRPCVKKKLFNQNAFSVWIDAVNIFEKNPRRCLKHET